MEFTGLNILDGKVYYIKINENNIIVDYKKIKEKKFKDFFCPGGLIDTQVNGYLGIDYSSEYLTHDNVEKVSGALLKNGTFQHFPTIVTRPQELILKNINTIVNTTKYSKLAQKSISGIHIEGPFISKENGPRGAHEVAFIRAANLYEFDEWQKAADGLLKIVTIAPEVKNAIQFIKHAVASGVTCSIGHTGASKKQIDEAVNAGANVSTHLGNGIYNLLNRSDNQILSQLANDVLNISLIVDGAHLTPQEVKVFSRCKKPNQIILISDLSPMAGLKGKNLKWGKIDVEVSDDGTVHMSGTPYLAGAGSMLLSNVFNYVRFTNASLAESFAAATINPVSVYKLDSERSSLKIGEKAEMIRFSIDANSNMETNYFIF
ncbi:MAG: N-acetylglucosamine-6-phosphate deacetylase [Sphaerochaeta sp.]